MRTRLATGCVAVILFVPQAAAFAGGANDWVLVHALAGPNAFEGQVSISVDIRTDASGPLVIGIGDAWADGSSYVGVDSYDLGHRSIDLGTPLIERHLELAPQAETEDRAWYTLGFQAFKNEPVSLLLFVGNGSFTGEPSVTVHPTVGSFGVQEIVTGSGATSVRFSQASDRTAVVAGSTGVGSVDHAGMIEDGIAGATAWLCERCEGAWTSPDGTHGEWMTSGTPLPFGGWEAEGWVSFAGPAGDWNWSFEGLVLSQGAVLSHRSEPLLIAYAPIGDAYELFDWHRFR